MPDEHPSPLIEHLHYQAILIPADVEHRFVPSNKIHGWEILLQTCGVLYFRVRISRMSRTTFAEHPELKPGPIFTATCNMAVGVAYIKGYL